MKKIEQKENNLSGLKKIVTYYPKIKKIDTDVLGLEKINIGVNKKITFVLTRFCNKNCPHCLAKIGKKVEKFDFDKFEQILRQFKSKGVESLVLSGGEPFVLFEKFGKIFDLIDKYGLKIDSLKTNLFKTDLPDYTEKFLFFVNGKEDLFIHGIEPSFDFYHSKAPEFDRLKKVIDINFYIIPNSSFVEKKFMNISIMRSNFNRDFEQVSNLLNFLFKNYKVKLIKLNLNESIDSQDEILDYIKENITTDYFLIELENSQGKKLSLRIGLNDVYKIGRAENISSNLVEKDIIKFNQSDLQRYSQLNILGIDIDGNIYVDEFSAYTGNFTLGNILNQNIDEILKEKQKDIVLYEIQNYGLKRLLPKLLVIYPELRGFKYTIYDDIWQKILTLPEIEKVLKVLAVGLQK